MSDAVGALPVGPPSPLELVLAQAGWGPRDLARAINGWLEARGRSCDRVNGSAAYPWIRLGYCPNNDIPVIAAQVLTDRLGQFISAEELWPGHARAGRGAAHALRSNDDSLDTSLWLLDHLANGGRVPAMSDTDIAVGVVSALLDPAKTHRPTTTSRDRVHPAQVAVIANHVAALRTLDDNQGGGAMCLRYVSRELSSVLALARHADYEPGVGAVLLTSIADLAQLSGWMWFDAGASDTAVWFLRLAVKVARAVGDNDRAANAAAMVSYVAAESGAGTTAMTIAEAACSVQSTSRLLSARVQGRLATAAAAVGDVAMFHRAADQAQKLLATAPADHTQPYLYYLTPEQLAAESGYSMVSIAARTTVHRTALLRQARDLLLPRAELAADLGYARSAVLHGCQLARVQLMLRDLDGAVAAARTAAELLPRVQSGRCVKLLRNLQTDLAKRRRSVVVAQYVPELESSLKSWAPAML